MVERSNDMRNTMRISRVSRLVAILACVAWLYGGAVWSEDTSPSVEAIAKKVKEKAKRTEKAEGKHDLADDHVRTKTNSEGEKVIEQVGEASYYGKWHHGKETASGETFDQNEMTAAHPTLPLGSEATVTNLENKKSVKVKITDRGPYVKGRDLDLSKAAAEEIGLSKKEGETPVKIEAVVPAEQEGTKAENAE